MVLLDNSLGERQTQSPASALGGEPGVKDGLEILTGYALAAVSDLDYCHASFLRGDY